MAQLKKLPPIPPKLSAYSTASATTSSTLNRSFGNNKNYSTLPTSGSGTAGPFNYSYSISNGSTKDAPLRGYFDRSQNRKYRVLSPEPENRYTPTVQDKIFQNNFSFRSFEHQICKVVRIITIITIITRIVQKLFQRL